jgi:hypothetical protein
MAFASHIQRELIAFVAALYTGKDTMHDWTHIERVRRRAPQFSETKPATSRGSEVAQRSSPRSARGPLASARQFQCRHSSCDDGKGFWLTRLAADSGWRCMSVPPRPKPRVSPTNDTITRTRQEDDGSGAGSRRSSQWRRRRARRESDRGCPGEVQPAVRVGGARGRETR